MPKIEDIEGIGPVYAKKLSDVGVKTVAQLLKVGAGAKGRDELAEKAGIDRKLILEWVNHADLYRIKGVGQEYSDLLEEAGVDTVVELATRNPENLYAKIQEVMPQEAGSRPPSARWLLTGCIKQKICQGWSLTKPLVLVFLQTL